MQIAERIARSSDRLTAAERRVAEQVLEAPEQVAFGTVAVLAGTTRTSGPTVLRLARKLGFDGFASMQGAVQLELGSQLKRAVDRINEPSGDHPLERSFQRAQAAVQGTWERTERAAFDRAVRLLAGRSRSTWVLSGEATAGVARMAADGLVLLRPEVELVAGSPVAVASRLAHVQPGDVVLAVDLRRYERWVVDATTAAAERGAEVVAVTDSLLSPLADLATETFVVVAEGAGPFDSHVGTLALLDALVAGVADRLRASAAGRLHDVERAWADHLVG